MNLPTQTSNQLLVRPELQKDESIRGYIMRLAEKNASPYLLKSLNTSFNGVVISTNEIANLSGVTLERLRTRGTKKIDMANRDAGYRIGESSLLSSQVFHMERYVCPLCISNDGISKCLWDLKFYDACHVHGCRLIGHCSACNNTLKWSSTSSDKCKCGFLFSDYEVIKASANRQTLCTLASKSLDKTLSISNKEKSQKFYQNIALPVDWFFVLLFFIHRIWIPYFWKKHLTQSMTLNHEQCERITIKILSDQGHCAFIQKTLAIYIERDPYILLKKFHVLNTFEMLKKYLLPSLIEIPFHRSLWRLTKDKSLFQLADPSQRKIRNQTVNQRRLEIDPGDINGNRRFQNLQKLEYFEILET